MKISLAVCGPNSPKQTGELVELIAVELLIIIDFFIFFLLHLDSTGAALCDQSNPKQGKNKTKNLLCSDAPLEPFMYLQTNKSKIMQSHLTAGCDVTESQKQLAWLLRQEADYCR